MTRVAILTSGGDAPGMNAAIRACVRLLILKGTQVYGFKGGYDGLIQNDFSPLDTRSVANIIQTGGTVLKTGRSARFLTEEGRKVAAQNLAQLGVEGLVVIGGDGSFQGAHLLSQILQKPCVGLPGTIDNDIPGSADTIGFDTAVNTAVQAIDKIRDTAISHDRVFIIEVMGRNSGHLATAVGLACGAEQILVPELPYDLQQICDKLNASLARGKLSSILVAAEGHKPGRAYDLAEQLRKKTQVQAKVCILGHIQRGGSPTARDRNLASQMAEVAVRSMLAGQSGYVGTQKSEILLLPFEHLIKSLSAERSFPKGVIHLADALSK